MAHVDYHCKSDYEIIDYIKSLKVGDKIKFKAEKQRYTIQAKSDRFIVCTKPFNPRKTYQYTVIDLDRYVRGTVGLVFGLMSDVNNQEGAMACIMDLENKVYEVSHRNCIELDVEIK